MTTSRKPRSVIVRNVPALRLGSLGWKGRSFCTDATPPEASRATRRTVPSCSIVRPRPRLHYSASAQLTEVRTPPRADAQVTVSSDACSLKNEHVWTLLVISSTGFSVESTLLLRHAAGHHQLSGAPYAMAAVTGRSLTATGNLVTVAVHALKIELRRAVLQNHAPVNLG